MSLRKQLVDQMLSSQPGTGAPQIDLGTFTPSMPHPAPEPVKDSGGGGGLGGLMKGMAMPLPGIGGGSSPLPSSPAGGSVPFLPPDMSGIDPSQLSFSAVKSPGAFSGIMSKLGGLFGGAF